MILFSSVISFFILETRDLSVAIISAVHIEDVRQLKREGRYPEDSCDKFMGFVQIEARRRMTERTCELCTICELRFCICARFFEKINKKENLNGVKSKKC